MIKLNLNLSWTQSWQYFANHVVDQQLALLLPVYFDMFLEKIVLKDVSSNDADWIRDLRFILIAAQKNYVLDAPLGDRPIAGANADVMNVWLAHMMTT